MMFKWEPDMIRFMKDASEYGNFNERLAGLIAPYITKDSCICDAGCGLGYLSLALSPYAGQVTAVDINERALSVLKENIIKRKISNVTVRCCDIKNVKIHNPFDHMALCFFGNIEEILAISRRCCRERVFVITRNYNNHRFSVSEIKREHGGGDYTCRFLERLGIPYERKNLILEMGQPFRDLKDARLFFETYSRDEDKSLITEQFIKSRLVATGREDFPFYMPHGRKVSFITFKASDIPDLNVNQHRFNWEGDVT